MWQIDGGKESLQGEAAEVKVSKNRVVIQRRIWMRLQRRRKFAKRYDILCLRNEYGGTQTASIIVFLEAAKRVITDNKG